MAVNPDNLDTATLIVDCLAGSGTVPADYSADDFAADSASRFREPSALPTDLGEAFTACNADPLGLLAGEQGWGARVRGGGQA